MDYDLTAGPPCLEMEGVTSGPGSKQMDSIVTNGQQLPPPLVYEGALPPSVRRKTTQNGGPQNKLEIFPGGFPFKRGGLPRGSHTPKTITRSPPTPGQVNSVDRRNSSLERRGIYRGAGRRRSRGMLHQRPHVRDCLGVGGRASSMAAPSSPPKSGIIGKAPPVGIFGVGRIATPPNSSTLDNSPSRSSGQPWMTGGYDPSVARTNGDLKQYDLATGQDVCIVSRVSPEPPDTECGGGPYLEEITLAYNHGLGTKLKSESESLDGDESGLESISCSPKRGASPAKVRHVASSESESALVFRHSIESPVKRGRGRGRGRGSRGPRKRGRGRGRGVVTRMRDPTRNLLVTGKRNSPLRHTAATNSLSSQLVQNASLGSAARKLGSSGFQADDVTTCRGRGSTRGRALSWRIGRRARGARRGRGRGGERGRGRGAGRGRGRGAGMVRGRGAGRGRGRGTGRGRGLGRGTGRGRGLGRSQFQPPDAAVKKSLAPYLGLSNSEHAGSVNYGNSSLVLGSYAKQTDPFSSSPFAAGAGLDGNGNVTSVAPASGRIRILSIEDVTVGHSLKVTPKSVKCIKPARSKITPTSPRSFQEGEEVLARWTDGLVYLGTIQKVEQDKEKCYVTFEDNSEHWVLYKDIQQGLPEVETEDITCTECNMGDSVAPNEIIICDKCEMGFHQLCHQPFIEDRFVRSEDLQWLCRKCIFSNAAKIGGASNRGSAAKMFQQVKRSLPYEIEELLWDKHHRTNEQRCYCYCGGPGEWYLKMLQCCRCMQWFHEACIQCLPNSMLYGDRFFIFVCSVCNAGPEYIKRLPLKWSDLTHLILYNLTLIHGKKYFILEDDVVPYLNENWNRLQVDHLGTKRSEKRSFLLDVVTSSATRFACGKEIRKKKDLWGLRNRTPPIPPSIVLPTIGQITDEVMESLESVEAAKVMTFVPAGSTTPVPKRRLEQQKQTDGRKRLGKGEQAKKRLLAAKSSKKGVRATSANQSYQGYAGTDPGPPRVQRRVRKSSILDSIEPLEEAFRKYKLSRIATVYHPRCFAQSSNLYLPSGRDPPPVSPPKRRGRPKGAKSLPKDVTLQGRKRKIKHVTNDQDSREPNRTSPRTGAGQSRRGALLNSITTYFGAEGRIANGEGHTVLAKRTSSSGQTEYLIQWEGTSP